MRAVVEFNGPGNNGSEVRDGVAYQIKAGDVVVIPAGTGHWFTKIDDHIDYLIRLSDGADRSRQGHATEERGAVAGLPVEAREQGGISAPARPWRTRAPDSKDAIGYATVIYLPTLRDSPLDEPCRE
jgi:hypothetical protein